MENEMILKLKAILIKMDADLKKTKADYNTAGFIKEIKEIYGDEIEIGFIAMLYERGNSSNDAMNVLRKVFEEPTQQQLDSMFYSIQKKAIINETSLDTLIEFIKSEVAPFWEKDSVISNIEQSYKEGTSLLTVITQQRIYFNMFTPNNQYK